MHDESGGGDIVTRVSRRRAMMGGLGLVLWQGDAASSRPKAGDVFVRVGDATKTPLTPRDVPVGAAQTLAWPMDPADGTVRSGSRLNQVILFHFDPGALSAETRGRAA